MDPDSYLCRLADVFDGIAVFPPSVGAVAALLLALALLYVSGLVSASETAFFSLSPSDLQEIGEGKHPSDRKVKSLLDDSERLLATVLVSNNFANVAVVLLLNYFVLSVADFGSAQLVGFIAVAVALAFLLLLFGEMIPKIYSAQNALAFVRKAAPVVCLLRAAFKPLSAMLVRSSFFIGKMAQRNKAARNLSVDELSQALELTDINETPEENNMLEGIIRFGEETAKEVMTSRLDMVDIEIKTPFSGVLKKMIDDLLRDFQANKIHIAVVVDEFGGTSGIVTMEDLIEEIVGEINDEYDDDERTYVKLTDNVYIFEAKTLLSDFYKILKADPDDFEEVAGDSDTLAGLVLELKGEFPFLHEIINYRNYRFEVLEMNSRRILRVKVTVFPPEVDKSKKEG